LVCWALLQSAKARWPGATVAISVWHVRKRAEDILIKHELHSRKKPYWRALRDSTKTAAAWRRFVTLARTPVCQQVGSRAGLQRDRRFDEHSVSMDGTGARREAL